jgi:hypothetical protein
METRMMPIDLISSGCCWLRVAVFGGLFFWLGWTFGVWL